MTHRPPWTAAQDAQLRRLRAEGADWGDIARALRRTPAEVAARGAAIAARQPPSDFAFPPDDPWREPLSAGHPRSWDPLVRGTLLDGDDYPLPCFSR
ncbi:MAG: AsnC family protein [Acetobacteraceae bacterium]|nr:AsnC family protein [Acetobacteraceae bacterium]